MARVRSRGNASTERFVAAVFRVRKIKGWRRHIKLPGSPDFFFARDGVAVFVHGCFWHGCPKCYPRLPRTNRAFWRDKIAQNRQRDRRATRLLRARRISVVTVWEHELRRQGWLARVVRRLESKGKKAS